MIGGRPMAALSVLVSGLDAELVRLGYKDSTMIWYRVLGGACSGASLPGG
jgi:hypothetical protein